MSIALPESHHTFARHCKLSVLFPGTHCQPIDFEVNDGSHEKSPLALLTGSEHVQTRVHFKSFTAQEIDDRLGLPQLPLRAYPMLVPSNSHLTSFLGQDADGPQESAHSLVARIFSVSHHRRWFASDPVHSEAQRVDSKIHSDFQ